MLRKFQRARGGPFGFGRAITPERCQCKVDRVSEVQLELGPLVIVRQFLQSDKAGLEMPERFCIGGPVRALLTSTPTILHGLRRVGAARVVTREVDDVV